MLQSTSKYKSRHGQHWSTSGRTEECDSDSDDDIDNMETEVDDIMNDIFDGYD